MGKQENVVESVNRRRSQRIKGKERTNEICHSDKIVYDILSNRDRGFHQECGY